MNVRHPSLSLRSEGSQAVKVDDRQPVGGPSKRYIDVAVAALALVLLLPLLLIIAALIKVQDGASPFYFHARVGFRGRQFRCMKFRSMVPHPEQVLAAHLARDPQASREWTETHKLRDDPRCTRLGRVLRRTSLDELPQLLNVLKGEMSLVGPRPIVEAEMDRYGSDLPSYLSARPGLTGLWQVSGRSELSYEKRVALDVSYVANWSLRQDVEIMMRTVLVVFRMRGSY